MAGTSKWWRRAGRLAFALVLSLMTFGPSLDGLVCHQEGGLSALAAEPSVTAAPTSDDLAGHAPDGGGACVHGHCHHAAPYVAPPLMITAEPVVGLARHESPQTAVPTSNPKFGLKRPPRG